MEDLTVNTQAAEIQRDQQMATQANVMQQMRGAAGSSGIAALAQQMASQGQLAAHQQAASIGQQEQANELRARGESVRIDQLQRGAEAKADLLERRGQQMVEQFDIGKVDKQLEFAMGRKQYADAAVDQARASRDAFLSSAVSSAIPLLAGGGVGGILGGLLGGK